MRELYIKQKIFSVGEKFSVVDAQERPQYFVSGSFMRVPKRFSIQDSNNREIGTITKKIFSWLPKFFVNVGNEEIVISKAFTLFKPKYNISTHDLTVNGNWWDMNFTVSKYGKPIAEISQKWFSWGDSYAVTILDEEFEQIVVSLVVAIDRVKATSSNY